MKVDGVLEDTTVVLHIQLLNAETQINMGDKTQIGCLASDREIGREPGTNTLVRGLPTQMHRHRRSIVLARVDRQHRPLEILSASDILKLGITEKEVAVVVVSETLDRTLNKAQQYFNAIC